jgi:ATP-dependent Clp protease protease subunit
MIIKTIRDLIKKGQKNNPEKAPEDCEGTAATEPDVETDEEAAGNKIVLIDPMALLGAAGTPAADPDLRIIGLFADVSEEKVGELVHGLLYLDEVNKLSEPEKKKAIKFYVSTYGGSADDMFALHDVMRVVRESSEIHTVGLGKVMSAGVLLLASGTKGKRMIGRNCRVMIHSVMGGNVGSLHNMANEMEAIEQLQDMYCECLVSETKLTKRRLKKILERKVNVYLTAEEAVEMGIADIII